MYTVMSGGVTETGTVTVTVERAQDPTTDPVPPADDNNARILSYEGLKATLPTVDGKVSEIVSRTYVEPVVRASQQEAMLAGERIDHAASPEQASPLFDAFGLSAPKSEFVSPVQQAAQKTSQADVDRTTDAVAAKSPADAGKAGSEHPAPIAAEPAVEKAALPRRGAESFTAQLRRGSETFRTAGLRSPRTRMQ